MGLNMRGDKNSLALLSSKRVKAYSRSKADEAFALPSFSDAVPVTPIEPQGGSSNAARSVHHPRRETEGNNFIVRPEQCDTPATAEHQPKHDAENLKQTMLQHESVFKEQLHELHRLYQKQCLLMAESKSKGSAHHPHSEPPSCNSSLLCNPDIYRSQEDVSLGDASATRMVFGIQEHSTLPSLIDDVATFHKVNPASRHKSRPMLDLERPAQGHPIFDLERPADEYMDFEAGEEEALAVGKSSTFVDMPDILAKKMDLHGVDESSLCTGYWMKETCKETFGSNERTREGFLLPNELVHDHLEVKEVPFFPMGPARTGEKPATRTMYRAHQEFVSCPARELPDLNSELIFAEKQRFFLQRKSEINNPKKVFIDLEAESRSSDGTSNLPHWLLQAPPAATTKRSPTYFSPQTLDGGWHRATSFFPQVHEESRRPSFGSVEKMQPSALHHSWSQSGTNFQHGEMLLGERSSKPLLRVLSNSTCDEGQVLYKGGHEGKFVNTSFPFLTSLARDEKGVSEPANCASRGPWSQSMDTQALEFEACAAPIELLQRFSSRETTASSTVPPWYQQSNFSSHMHQASKPELSKQCPSHVSSVDTWGTATSHEFQPSIPEKGIFGMHKIDGGGINFEAPSALDTGPDNASKRPVFEFMSGSSSELGLTLGGGMKRNETITRGLVERAFYVEEIAQKNHQFDLNSRTNDFDLNVSSGQCPTEEDAYQIKDAPHECFKHKYERERSLDCRITLTGTKASHSEEQQTLQTSLDRQATGFANRVADRITAAKIPIAEQVAHSHCNNSTFTTKKANVFCSHACTYGFSGEDETGGFLVGGKSSDGSGLTSCESRDAVHLALTKARDDSNTSSGEACQSRESRIPGSKEDGERSSNVQWSGGMPLEELSGMAGNLQLESLLFSAMQSSQVAGGQRKHSMVLGAEFTDESEAADDMAKDLIETAEAAELLLSLGVDLPSVCLEGRADPEGSLNWLANIIPQEENCETAAALYTNVAGVAMDGSQCKDFASGDIGKKVLDPFELAVLMLEPINPEVESVATLGADRGYLLVDNNCSSLPTVRRRSSRRGRAGKDFQRSVLRSMSSLSRQEVTEDFQMIEGLIKSSTEAMNSSSSSPEQKHLSSSELGSFKNSGKIKDTKFCRVRRQNGVFKVCSWGESTRRKRMGRQRKSVVVLTAS